MTNGNEFGKYASWLNIIARLTIEAAGNGMTVLQILENSQESNLGKSPILVQLQALKFY